MPTRFLYTAARALPVAVAACIAIPGPPSAGAEPILVPTGGPAEISGVALLADGRYAVVGDDTHDHGRVWPGGDSFRIEPRIGGPESLDVAYDGDGRELWLVLGEQDRVLGEPEDARARLRLADEFDELCGRGLEGLSLRRTDEAWEAVVLWEGGYLDPHKCEGDGESEVQRATPYLAPRLAVVRWQARGGAVAVLPSVALAVPVPASGRFRAPDLAWYGDEVIVLLAATGAGGGPPFAHTWLQRFDLQGNPVGEPVKLEERWGSFREGRNWEALDIAADRATFVMAYDSSSMSGSIVVFSDPFR